MIWDPIRSDPRYKRCNDKKLRMEKWISNMLFVWAAMGCVTLFHEHLFYNCWLRSDLNLRRLCRMKADGRLSNLVFESCVIENIRTCFSLVFVSPFLR
jgi:hypothetical protein